MKFYIFFLFFLYFFIFFVHFAFFEQQKPVCLNKPDGFCDDRIFPISFYETVRIFSKAFTFPVFTTSTFSGADTKTAVVTS